MFVLVLREVLLGSSSCTLGGYRGPVVFACGPLYGVCDYFGGCKVL